MLLIDAEGNKRGVVPTADALREAEELGLDLVEVASTEQPPVCKIMDYGKMAYQAKKKKTHVKSATELKEISFSMKISGHDIETKLKQARQFVEKGHKLRFNLILRGRERAYADTQGMTQLRRLIELMRDVASVEQMSEHMMGNRLFAILAPNKVKPVKKEGGNSAPSASAKPAGSPEAATAAAPPATPPQQAPQ
ncbi:translation initiation factor IF-3 [bacterium]|nr:translation initiation factor IF-3 [bacterium]